MNAMMAAAIASSSSSMSPGLAAPMMTTTTTPQGVRAPATMSSSASSSDANMDPALAEALKWENISAPGMVYRGDIVKMVQKLLGLAVFDQMQRRESSKAATRYNMVEVEYRKLAEDFVKRKGVFADERLVAFFDGPLRKYLTFERGRAIPLGALLASKYPAKGEPITMKEGSKLYNDAYDVKRYIANTLMPAMEKRLVRGVPPKGKTWDDVLEEVRQEFWLDKLRKSGNADIDPMTGHVRGAVTIPDDDWIPHLTWLAFILYGQYGRHKYGTSLSVLLSFGNGDEEEKSANPDGAAEAGGGKRARIETSDTYSTSTFESAVSLHRYMTESKNVRSLLKSSMKMLDTPHLVPERREEILAKMRSYQTILENLTINPPQSSSTSKKKAQRVITS